MEDLFPPVIENAIVPADALAWMLESAYPLPRVRSCTFIDRGFNDHYLVDAGTARYVCRVYLNGKYYIRSEDDFRLELALLAFLHGRGVPVSYPIRRRDDDLLGWIATSAGARACALFSYAEGREVELQKVNEQQAANAGVAAASFHRAADDFRSPHSRYHLDLGSLIEQPLARIERRGSDEHRARLTRLPPVEELTAVIRTLPMEGDGYGIIHGDLHPGNMRFADDDTVTLFDFDHCAYGWRAYDLAVLRMGVGDDAWEAFVRGYESVRPLADWERAIIPTFRHARMFWDMGDMLAMEPLWAAGDGTSHS